MFRQVYTIEPSLILQNDVGEASSSFRESTSSFLFGTLFNLRVMICIFCYLRYCKVHTFNTISFESFVKFYLVMYLVLYKIYFTVKFVCIQCLF